jgi:hypothetical protein
MLDPLVDRLAGLLARPRALAPQTERQIASHLAEHKSTSLATFLLAASALLEEYELDVVFAPLFTPTLDERAELADLLFHWRPAAEQLRDHVVPALCGRVGAAAVLLPDGSQAQLPLHEVMVERFVRLLRLDGAADATTAAALRDALPAELWPVGVALLCERGMTPAHQKWFAAFVNHARTHRPMTRQFLESAAAFIASQNDLSRGSLLSAAEALMRATQSTTAFAAAGHSYWSGDVAQHHHYRGQGNVDKERLAREQAELERVTALVEDLKTFPE